MNLQSVRQVAGGVRAAAIQMLKELESSCLLSWDHWGRESPDPICILQRLQEGRFLGHLGLLYVNGSWYLQ